MRKALLALAVAGSISATFGVQAQETPEGYQLEQVLIMSRHNLRAPLANNGSVLEQSTPKQWPEWEVPGGQLTTKGGVLEVYMGHYMREWLAQQGMIKTGECPPADTVYAYANSLQRTVAHNSSLPARSRGAMCLCIIRKKWARWIPPLIRSLPITRLSSAKKR